MPVTKEQNYQVRQTGQPLVRGGLALKPWVKLDLEKGMQLNWSGVCWSPLLGLFCAVSEGEIGGADGAIITSSDGETWNSVSLSPYVGYWMGAHWSTIFAKFFIVSKASAGGSNLQVFSSSDGTNWTGHSLPTEREWTSIVTGWYNTSKIAMVVSKTGQIAFSSDLSTWTEIGVAGHYYNAVAHQDYSNIFFAVGELGRIAKIELTSTTTATLTESDGTPITYTKIAWSGVCWSSDLNGFILVPRYGIKNSGNDYCAAVSYDGIFVDNGIDAPRSGDWTSINLLPDVGNYDSTHTTFPLAYVTGNTALTETYSNDETETGTAPITPNTKIGQAFTSPRKGGIRLDTVTLQLKLSASSVESKDMTVAIYTLAAGVPSALVGTSAIINKNTLTTSYQDVEFVFTDLRLDADKYYAFVFEVSGTYSQYVIIGTTNNDSWSGGYAVSYNNGSWTVAPTYDLAKFTIAMSLCDSNGNSFDYAAMTRRPTGGTWRMRSLGGWDLKSAAHANSLNRICTVGYETIGYQDVTFNMEEIFSNMNTMSKEMADLIPTYLPDLLEVETDTANITGDVFGITGQAIQMNGIKTLQVGANLNGGSELDVYDEGTLHDINHIAGVSGDLGLSSGTKLGQNFLTPDIGGVKVSTITLRIKLSASSVETNNMYVDVYNVDNGQGRPGTLLGSSSAVNKNTLTTEYQDVVFNLGGLALTKATVYALVFRVDGAHTQTTIFEYTDGTTSYSPGSIWAYNGSSWNNSGGTYDLSHFHVAFTFAPTSSWNTDDGPAPVTINWCKFTRVGFVCFIDLSMTWGSQTAAQIAFPVSLANLPFDGENGFIQFLSMNEARDTEAYSVYYTHTPYIYNAELYFKKTEDMLIAYDDSPEPLAIPNGLAGKTVRVSGFYFVA